MKILIAFCACLFCIFGSIAETIRVCPECAVKTIAQGLVLAQDKDVIRVGPGTYREHGLTVQKSISLIGEGVPVIDGELKGEIFIIKSNGVTLSGFKIKNVGISQMVDRAAIRLIQSSHCIISENILVNSYFGIYLQKSRENIIRNNKVAGQGTKESESGNAIHLWNSSKNKIHNNTLAGHRDGIYLEFSDSCYIAKNQSEKQIRYGLHFMFSNTNEFESNTFRNNGGGVAIMYSKFIYMHHNDFSDNWSPVSTGLLLKDISDSRLVNNRIQNNTAGVWAEGCQRTLIESNDFIKNGWAFKILGSAEENKILNNNFIANTFEVVTNASDNHNVFENNYWSEYAGYDLDRNGIGDVPYSPVRMFTYIVELIPPAIVLLRSLFVELMNLAEKVTPVITPASLSDEHPLMKPIPRNANVGVL